MGQKSIEKTSDNDETIDIFYYIIDCIPSKFVLA